LDNGVVGHRLELVFDGRADVVAQSVLDGGHELVLCFVEVENLHKHEDGEYEDQVHCDMYLNTHLRPLQQLLLLHLRHEPLPGGLLHPPAPDLLLHQGLPSLLVVDGRPPDLRTLGLEVGNAGVALSELPFAHYEFISNRQFV